MLSNSRPHVSVIIVNHYTDDILPDCLSAVAGNKHALSVEVIVVDNPAVENIEKSDDYPGMSVRRITARRRLGFGAACNLGVTHSAGRYILLLNPDVVLDVDAISRLHAVMTGADRVGITVGRLVGADGRFQPSCRRFPTLTNLIFSRGSVLRALSRSERGKYTLPDYDDVTQVDAAAAAMMMIPRELFDRVGGFDESFFMYMEDTDLCRRVAENGHKVLYVPQASGRHLWGYSTARYRFRRILWHHRSLWIYFAKHRRSPATLPILAPALAVNCFLSLLLELLTLRR